MSSTPIDSLALAEQYERMCAGKEKFPSEAAALAAIKLLRHDGELRKPHQLNPYPCKFCGEYHYGH